MAKTLLAVDDSVTMRKVLEITFSGEDFRVVTADNSQGALGKTSENPQICVIDTMLGGEDGYSLAKELRKRIPGTSIIMLASRYAPYDQARGRDAGADDWADKPFDTQQLIDKVRKVMLAREGGGITPAVAPGAAAGPYRSPATVAQQPPMAAASPTSGGVGRGTQPSLSGSVPQRFGSSSGFGESASAAAGSTSAANRPGQIGLEASRGQSAPAPAQTPTHTHASSSSTGSAMRDVTGSVNGQLQGKLGELGLTPAQADAVLALSREVVERIVWEVVPQLAEAIIKEEIARLTKD